MFEANVPGSHTKDLIFEDFRYDDIRFTTYLELPYGSGAFNPKNTIFNEYMCISYILSNEELP